MPLGWKLLRLGAAAAAVSDCLSDFARPSSELFKTVIGITDESEASFEGLEKNPETRSKSSDRPGDKDKKNEPKEGETRISAHREGM